MAATERTVTGTLSNARATTATLVARNLTAKLFVRTLTAVISPT